MAKSNLKTKTVRAEGELRKRKDIIAACLKMNALGINQGTSGNISIRHCDGLLITPTSTPYEDMKPADIVFFRLDSEPTPEQRASSEWRFHRDIMRAKPDVEAIVHAHPIFCTTIAILGHDIPAVHYMIAVAGGSTVRCAPYATFGTAELSAHAVAALKDRKACLLQHHGLIATGSSVGTALWLAVEMETLARQYHGVLQIGKPPVLPEKEIQSVISRIASYGYQGKSSES